MKKHLTHQDVSAYIDGEHHHADRVQRHLQQCAECAQRHVAMAKLSAHVSTLTTPELSDTFAARVMREIESREETTRPRGLRLSFPIAVAATFLLVAALTWRVNTPRIPDETSALASNNTPVVVDTVPEILPMTEAALFSEDDYFQAMIQPDTSSENVMLAFAGADIFSNTSPEWFEGESFHTTVNNLSADERETFVYLLSSYVISGNIL